MLRLNITNAAAGFALLLCTPFATASFQRPTVTTMRFLPT